MRVPMDPPSVMNPPWAWPWWRAQDGQRAVLFWVVLIHVTAAFFWLGAIRLVFALHAQCFVNSVSHRRAGTHSGEDSSRNVPWLSVWHLFQGENWHRNHHARPGSARLGWTPLQLDVGWWVILGLERLGFATEVRRPRKLENSLGWLARVQQLASVVAADGTVDVNIFATGAAKQAKK